MGARLARAAFTYLVFTNKARENKTKQNYGFTGQLHLLCEIRWFGAASGVMVRWLKRA